MKDFVPLVPPSNASSWKRQASEEPTPPARSFQRSLLSTGVFAGGLGDAPLPDPPRVETTPEEAFAAAQQDLVEEEEEPPPFVPAVQGPDPELLARIDELEARDAARSAAHDEAMQRLAEREKEIASSSARLVAAAKGLDAARHAVIMEIREGVGPVILEAARRIAGDQLHVDPRLLDAVVEEAVRALGRDGLLVRVAPADLKLVRARLQPLGIEVIEDAAISAGAVCEGPTGRIDASLETAARAIQSVLEQWRTAP
jgi:flagellar biosynthesis/type III secretory pathway protein FliH